MVHEVVGALGCRPGGNYVDATVGAGGHAAAILEASGPDGFLVGVDRDGEILALAAERLAAYGGRFVLVQGNFRELRAIVAGEGRDEVDGVLIDLGLSSLQVDCAERGFSFRTDAPLDMRMDRREERTARDLVRDAAEEDLARLIREYGEEPQARRIARAICRERDRGRLTTLGLAQTIAAAVGGRGPRAGKIHPATRTFQALRIAVNREMEALAGVLQDLPDLLLVNGRACVLSYHSLEARTVKRTFREWAHHGLAGSEARFEVLTKKPVRPSIEEVRSNPRARSACLRAIRRAA